jgi:hypothetical protein
LQDQQKKNPQGFNVGPLMTMNITQQTFLAQRKPSPTSSLAFMTEAMVTELL